MYEPLFRVYEGGFGFYHIDVGDFDNSVLGFWQAHFTVTISSMTQVISFKNEHTGEEIIFKGSSDTSRCYGYSQYSYDVFIKRHKKDVRHKIGTMLVANQKEYKNYLTPALKKCAIELEKKYGTDWVVFK